MPINLIISILSKLQLGKIKKPTVEIDKIEHLEISKYEKENIFIHKADNNLKKSDKIVPIYIKDIKKDVNYQIYEKLYQLSFKYINNINNVTNKDQILKRKNKAYVYFILISLIAAGLYYVYKYFEKIKENIDIFYEEINNFITYLPSFFNWLGESLEHHLILFFNLVYNNTLNIINDIQNTFNKKYNLIISYFDGFFNYVINEIEKLIDDMIGIISNIKIIEQFNNFLNSIKFVFFTASFKDGNKTEEKYYKEDNFQQLNKVEIPKELTEKINQTDNFENDILNLQSFNKLENNLYNYKNIPNINVVNTIHTTKNMQDGIIFGTQTKFIAKKYNNFKAAISEINSSFKKELNVFESTVNTNINKWNELFI